MPKGPGRQWVLDAFAEFQRESSPDYVIASLTAEELGPAFAIPWEDSKTLVESPVRVFIRQGQSSKRPPPSKMTAAHLDAVLTEALALRLPAIVTPAGEQEVLSFVRKWGRLGVGLRGRPDCRVDEVVAVYAELRTFSVWWRAYDAFRQRRLDDPILQQFVPPRLRNRRGFQETLPRLFMRQLELKHAQGLFHGMFPALTYRPRQGFQTTFWIPDATLFDVLWLGLWASLLDGVPPQTCPVCGEIFVPNRGGQRYCSRPCQNRIAQRAHYARVRRRRRQAPRGE
jgi:hypothetical protein